VWIVNRVKQGDMGWKESLLQRYPSHRAWLDEALPVRTDPRMDDVEDAAPASHEGPAASDADLEQIRERIFG
jgi:hypothetical protein